MARPTCKKNIDFQPAYRYFTPTSKDKVSSSACIEIESAEFESIRLCCYEDSCMENGAKKMGISAATFNRLKRSAQKKICQALVLGKGIIIN